MEEGILRREDQFKSQMYVRSVGLESMVVVERPCQRHGQLTDATPFGGLRAALGKMLNYVALNGCRLGYSDI